MEFVPGEKLTELRKTPTDIQVKQIQLLRLPWFELWRHTLALCFISGFHCTDASAMFFCDDRETCCAFCTTFVNGKSRVVLLSLLSALFYILLLAWCIACWVGSKTTGFAKKVTLQYCEGDRGGSVRFFLIPFGVRGALYGKCQWSSKAFWRGGGGALHPVHIRVLKPCPI